MSTSGGSELLGNNFFGQIVIVGGLEFDVGTNALLANEGLVGGDTGSLQGRNLLADPSDEDEFAALAVLLINSHNTETTVEDAVFLQVSFEFGEATIALAGLNDSVVITVGEEDPVDLILSEFFPKAGDGVDIDHFA
jgi:hypothetical protein